MPQFDPKGGFSGAVDQFQQSYQPRFNKEQVAQAERDAADREKYFAAEAQREMQRYAIRRPGQPPPFQSKAPLGTIDEAQLAAIADAISANGLHIDWAKALEYGKAKFAELLSLGRELRKQIHLKVEPASFVQLSEWVTNLFPSPLQPLGLTEQLRGEKFPPEARIDSLDAVWKCPPDPLLNQLYAHWQAFRSLVFGQSLLDAADSDNRVRSPFWSSSFISGINKDHRLELFDGWKAFIVPPPGETFVVIELGDLLVSAVAWLADDDELARVDYHDIARELTNLRSPQPQHIAKAHALVEAFALGLDAHLAQGKPALEVWSYLNGAERDHTKVRHQLGMVAKRFPATGQWLGEAIAAAIIPQPTYDDGVSSKFDAALYRTSLNAAIWGAIRHARALTALAVEETCQESSRLAAVIGDKLIICTALKGITKQQLVAKLQEAVTTALLDAFPRLAPKLSVTVKETL